MTSIEWLWEQIDGIIPYQDIKTSQLFNGVLEQAKEMHKQEIIDAYETSHISMMTSEQYYQETFVSKGNDEHKGKLKELYPDAFSILGEVLYKKCQFKPTSNTSSATICANCGREKFLHKT
jgi:hypothetical protein